jgi:hypothetical protein
MSQTRLVKDEADFSHNYDNNRPEVLVADFGMAAREKRFTSYTAPMPYQILHLRGTTGRAGTTRTWLVISLASNSEVSVRLFRRHPICSYESNQD